MKFTEIFIKIPGKKQKYLLDFFGIINKSSSLAVIHIQIPYFINIEDYLYSLKKTIGFSLITQRIVLFVMGNTVPFVSGFTFVRK